MDSTTPLSFQRLIAAGCHLVVLVLCGIQLYLLTLPPTPTPIPEPTDSEAFWWGLWPITYLPFQLGFIFTGLILALLLLIWRGHIPYLRLEEKRANYGLIFLIALLLVGFYLLPVAHTRWGDAYMLARGLAWPDITERITHSWQAPLDVFLHSSIWLWLHQPLGWNDDATGVYRLLSPLAGGLFLYVAYQFSRIHWPGPGWLVFSLLTSLGLMQLFFGYVENYSFAAAGVLAYLWFGIRVLRGESALWQAAIVLGVTNSLHPSTIVLAPSMLYLFWNRTFAPFIPRRQKLTLVSALSQVVLPLLLMAAFTIGMMELGGHGLSALFTTDRPGGGDGRWFVPLFETQTRWEHYTLFSWPHLRDFLNEQLLVAPVVLPVLLIIIVAERLLPYFLSDEIEYYSRVSLTLQRLRSVQHESIFLLIASIFYLLFTWVWNPDYGGQRDWDLFSLASIPLTLLLAWRLPMLLVNRRTLAWATLPLIAFQVQHLVAWIYQNVQPWQWPE